MDVDAFPNKQSQSPLISIVTPVFREQPEIIERCLLSVDNAGDDVEHIVIVDGTNHDLVSHERRHIIKLPINCNDYGDTPRAMGAAFAFGREASLTIFLDADNQLVRNFRQISHKLLSAEADVQICQRLNIDAESNQKISVPPQNFWDTSQFVFSKKSIPQALSWVNYPRPLSIIDDRMISHFVKASNVKLLYQDFPIIEYSYTKGKIDRSKAKTQVKLGSEKLNEYLIPFNVKVE